MVRDVALERVKGFAAAGRRLLQQQVRRLADSQL
jgi:hypothetical protein